MFFRFYSSSTVLAAGGIAAKSPYPMEFSRKEMEKTDNERICKYTIHQLVKVLGKYGAKQGMKRL